MFWVIFLTKNIIKCRINLKLVPKFQVFCCTIKCTTLQRLPNSYTNLQTSSIWNNLRWQNKFGLANTIMGAINFPTSHCFVSSMHLWIIISLVSLLLGTSSSLKYIKVHTASRWTIRHGLVPEISGPFIWSLISCLFSDEV